MATYPSKLSSWYPNKDNVITNIKRYIDERLPEEYEKYDYFECNYKRNMQYFVANRRQREKVQILSLVKERYSMKLDLLTNATLVDYAVRFVERILEIEEMRMMMGLFTK